MKIDSHVPKMKLFHVKGYKVHTDREAKKASFTFSASRSEIQALFPDNPMIGVAAKAPPAAKTKAKGKGEAPAAGEGQVQTALNSDLFAPPHGHDSAFQEGGRGGGGAGPIGGDLVPSRAA
jgi:hypothetical protein